MVVVEAVVVVVVLWEVVAVVSVFVSFFSAW